MDTSSIWTVALLGLHKDRRVNTRTFGYYFDSGSAVNGLLKSCSSEAGYYTHAVVENILPGIYAEVVSESWFVWGEEANGWEPCEKPPSEKNCINYGMG